MRRDRKGELFHIRRTIVFLIALVIIVAAVLLVARKEPKFLLTELKSDGIFADEETILNVQIRNPTTDDYDNVEIHLATKSPHVRFIPYPEATLARVGDENRLVLAVGFLGSQEVSKKYGFRLSATLPQGTLAMDVELVVRVLMDNEKAGERAYTLKIKTK